MRVVVTGATGFTGRRVVAGLLETGHDVTCFVRPTSDLAGLPGGRVSLAVGDLDEPRSLERALRGAAALVNVASVGFGHAPGIVRAAERAGVGRAVFFSTTAVFTTLRARSRGIRLAAEETIRRSALGWTILRPTMIYGAPGDRNVERLFRALARWPILPVLDRGERKIQPVVVDDLGDAARDALESDRAARRCYAVAGARAVRFRDFVRAAGRAMGRAPRLLSIPGAAAVRLARIFERGSPRPRIRAEQLERLREDKDFDISAARRDFGYAPRTIEDGLCLEAVRLGLGARA